MRRRLKYHKINLLDIILCVLVLGSNIFFLSPLNHANLVTIVAPGHKIHKPIGQDWTLSVDGLLGRFTIANNKGVVTVIETNCLKKICMKGKITKDGGLIICQPNQVYIYLEGDYDAVTR